MVKIRWFGVVMGYILVQTRTGLHDPSAVRAFLALGAGYAALDLAFWRLGEVFLKRWPLFVSFMESVFIALLCYHDTGLASPFRWYYLLSLDLLLDPLPAGGRLVDVRVSLPEPAEPGRGARDSTRRADSGWPLTSRSWPGSTWAARRWPALLKAAGDAARAAERRAASEHRDELERRVDERTDALRASQARVIQQEKMAAFGLLAAGIAHEVGNPLAALSSLVQMLQRREPDPYTAEKLDLAGRAARSGSSGRSASWSTSRGPPRRPSRGPARRGRRRRPSGSPSTTSAPSSGRSRPTIPADLPRSAGCATT